MTKWVFELSEVTIQKVPDGGVTRLHGIKNSADEPSATCVQQPLHLILQDQLLPKEARYFIIASANAPSHHVLSDS